MLLLAILLPVQGFAGACAQICAVAQHQPSPTHHGEAAPHEDCEKSDIGTGKCCQAHVYVAAQPVAISTFEPPAVARAFFVARWTNFIPEEPSPPPIGATARA